MKFQILSIFAVGFLLSSHAFAESFQCEVKMNTKSVLITKVVSVPGQKILISTIQEVRAFITENPNHLFTLEVFLPSIEARAYSQATMRMVSDIIDLTYWDRQMLYEIQCTAI